ncbi:hypothetical protein ABW16_10550 [Mycolicibacter heraklionensis]|uniref:Nucleotidyltransferase n=1 Tax=Mycolicibacter heraklionensis TaxID=512402 RepID=A0ABR5FFN6_9MYCO|nr:nucleotidyl transferase AbiEii/AbiGii toxin family protein [Mycolicibacter heraklionensis]KLO29016.1 hypothetical protein ABW16_10550 [Mycolicibacter heraklionensis]
MPEVLQPGPLLEVLLRHGVRFVLIGGFAAIAHGSPFPTEDIDITPEASSANLKRLSDALTELGAKIRTEGADGGLPFARDEVSLAAGGVWNLVTRYGDLDISLVPSGTTGYPDLVKEATDQAAFGLLIPTASLADIIRSKQAANRLKDQRVLPVLREILASRHGRPTD